MQGWVTKWLAPVVLLAGIVVIIWSLATPESGRTYFQWGVFQVSLNYDQAIPFVAFGGAISLFSPLSAAVTAILFAAAFLLGLFTRSPLLPFIGPLSLIIAGVMLIVPGRGRVWTVPPLAVLLGLAVAMTISFDAPPDENWRFYVAGGTQIGAWFIAVAVLIWQALPKSWAMIAMPILGSWFIAIGLLLVGATVAESPEVPTRGSPQDESIPDQGMPQ